MPRASDLLATARSSYARGDWPEAYRLLCAERARGELETDDLAALADAAWWLGLIKETLIISEECHRRYLDEGRPVRAAVNALEVGFSWILRGQAAIGSGWLSRGRQLLADQPDCAEQAFPLWLDAAEAIETGDFDTALVAARQVRDIGQRFGSPTLISLALVPEGVAAIHQGEVRRGFALLDEAMLPVLAGQVQAEWAGNIYCQLMAICHDVADFNRARQWTAATQQWCEGLSSAVMFLGICRLHRVQLLELGGEWGQAEAEAEVACRELAELNATVVAEAHYELAEVLRLRGNLTSAETAYCRAGDLGRNPQPGLALLHLAQGRLEEVAAEVRMALADHPAAPFRRARLQLAHAEIALVTGDLEAATRSSDELSQIADQYPTPGFTAWAAQARGAVLLGKGQAREAVAELSSALSRYEELRAPYLAARVRLLLAEACQHQGEIEQAVAERAAAEAALTKLGATPPPRLPSRPSDQPGRTGPLTVREAEVLTRLAEGCRNREIAAALFISEKTVARHLANIYLKLGVSSRTAASAWAYQHGLLDKRARL